MNPAKKVGGDFYDFFMIDDDHLALVLGDVSDKGIPAALFMMTAKTLIKFQAQQGLSPSEVLESVNAILFQSNPEEMFVTVWIGIPDLKTGILTASNAGHELPILSLEGKPFEIFHDPHGMVLAALRESKYKDYELTLKPGHRIVIYSDGVSDAQNRAQEPFGINRLLETVQFASADPGAEGFTREIWNRIMRYSEGTAQFDDITLLSVTYTGPVKESEEKGNNQH